MSVSTTIKNQILSKVLGCSTVQTVYGHEELNPTGWPSVMVTATDMDGEFSSNAENSRLYAYRVLALFPIGGDFPQNVNTNRLEYAEQVLADVVDEIIEAVDTDFELDGSPVLFVNAADCVWAYTEYEGGEARSAQITLRVYTEKAI